MDMRTFRLYSAIADRNFRQQQRKKSSNENKNIKDNSQECNMKIMRIKVSRMNEEQNNSQNYVNLLCTMSMEMKMVKFMQNIFECCFICLNEDRCEVSI